MTEIDSINPDAPRIARLLIVARPALSRALSTMLAGAGYEVHRTPDAASAVEAARRLRPQVAIVAPDVPGSSGAAVGHLLRASQANLPVILLDTVSRDPDSTGMIGVPADASPAALLAVIAGQLPGQIEE